MTLLSPLSPDRGGLPLPADERLRGLGFAAWETALAETTEAELHLRTIYRFEMEHLLARAGFAVEALYGDFDEGPLTEDCREMVWVARKP